MQITTNIAPADFKEIYLDIYKTRMKKAIVIMAILWVFSLLTWATGIMIFEVIRPQLIVLPLVIILVFFLLNNSATATYNTTPRLHGFTTWNFAGNTLSIANASVSTIMDLCKAHKIEEMKKSFLIYESAMTCHYLPKKDLSAGDIRTLRSLFQMLNRVQKVTLRQD